MRDFSLATELQRRDRLRANRMTLPVSIERPQAWRVRALREATAVRRAIRGAMNETNGVLGFVASLGAARDGSANELLVTRRFAERFPVSAASVRLLAATSGTPITTVTGVAEMELDLAGGGIAALLRRSAVVR